jgi:hypothetical protein
MLIVFFLINIELAAASRTARRRWRLTPVEAGRYPSQITKKRYWFISALSMKRSKIMPHGNIPGATLSRSPYEENLNRCCLQRRRQIFRTYCWDGATSCHLGGLLAVARRWRRVGICIQFYFKKPKGMT